MPSNAKKWNLLANHSDKTLLRNKLGFKISSLFEMKYTPECQPVDLMVNGEYKGNFDFCDQFEQGEGRVEIAKMTEKILMNLKLQEDILLNLIIGLNKKSFILNLKKELCIQ